jgi:hypothetical protein
MAIAIGCWPAPLPRRGTSEACNVPEAANAEDDAQWVAVADNSKTPPEGMIYRKLQGPVTNMA